MTKKRTFTDEQVDLLVSVVRRHLKRFKTQEDMALALDITQPSLSNLLKKKWRPGPSTARLIAQLEGVKLEELLGPEFAAEGASQSETPKPPSSTRAPAYPNLDVCIAFHAGTKNWSAWTVAAAHAGYFGLRDFPAPEWAQKLDELEKTFERARK